MLARSPACSMARALAKRKGTAPPMAAHLPTIFGTLANLGQRDQAHASRVSRAPTVSAFHDADQEEEGTRVGRYILLRDEDGCLHALSSSAVTVLRECDEGCMLLLTGSRMLRVSHPLSRVLAWLTL